MTDPTSPPDLPISSDAPALPAAPVVAAPPMPGDGPWRGTRTMRVATVLFTLMALVDAVDPEIYVTGAWWVVLMLVWLMRWPAHPIDESRAGRLTQLAAIGVFSWLFYRINTAILGSLESWQPEEAARATRAFLYMVSDLCSAICAAALLGRPVVRTFKRAAVPAAFVIATPWLILTSLDTAFDPVGWFTSPLSNAVWLFDAILPTLVLMWRCERISAPDPARNPLLVRTLNGDAPLRWIALAALILAPLTGWLLFNYFAVPEPWMDRIPLADAAWELAIVATALLLSVSVLALLRTLRRRDRRIGRLELYRPRSEWLIALALLGPAWFLTTFHAAPVIGDSLGSRVQAWSVPAWSIKYDHSTRRIRLSGEYGEGIADDFEQALETHPDATAVELEGPGGLLDEGTQIAQLIESRNLVTVVTDECSSACTYAFAGGHTRALEHGGRLGFHDSRSPSVLLEWFKDTSSEDYFLTERGYDRDFIARTHDVPSYDIWYPTRAELKSAGVVTITR